MTKIDLKKDLEDLYRQPAGKISFVDVPSLQYLMIDGAGDPNGSKSFEEAVELLYGLSYTLKFMVKKGPMAVDYGVMPLEGLWWTDDLNHFSMDRKEDWKWTLMILQPDLISVDMVAEAERELVRKRGPLHGLERVRFEDMTEGRCAQLLYVGPYDEEPPTIRRLHEFIHANGYECMANTVKFI